MSGSDKNFHLLIILILSDLEPMIGGDPASDVDFCYLIESSQRLTIMGRKEKAGLVRVAVLDGAAWFASRRQSFLSM